MMSALDKPLAGIGVLVTRPTGQAEVLCGFIEAAGGVAVRLPLLDIVPCEKPYEAVQRLSQLDAMDWLIFVSANAVRFAFQQLDWNKGMSRRPRVAAIGRATAQALARRGIAVDLAPKQQFNSEALLALPELSNVAGRRFLIVRGTGGRETLAEALQARGAEVAYAEVYRRVLPKTDVGPLIEHWRAGAIGVVTITSGEALSNLSILLAGKGTDLLAQTPLVVISERLEQQARSLGWVHVATTKAASDEAIVDSVISLAASI